MGSGVHAPRPRFMFQGFYWFAGGLCVAFRAGCWGHAGSDYDKPMPAASLPLDGCIRVSHVGGRTGDRFQSPSTQRDAIEGWAKAHGVTIGIIHEDLDVSGGTMDRPGMNTALQRVRDGVSGGVIVSRLDRFARTLIGGLTIIHELHAQGARVVSVAESLDPATPMGRAMLGLLLIMAEWQRDQADEHIAGAQRRAALAGRFATRPNFGYRRDADGRTVVDLEAAEIVRRVFGLRARGVGWRTIAESLDDDGVLPPAGGGHWSTSTLAGLVGSRAYLGEWVGPRGLSDREAWPAIVSPDVWEAANSVRGVADNALKHQDRLCLGVARCAGCRVGLKRVVNPAGFVSYGCQTRWCGQRSSMGVRLLDEHVRGLIDARLAGITLSAVQEDGEGERLAAARAAAVTELELWRDDLGLRAALGPVDWREGMLARATARDTAETAVARYRARRGVMDLGGLGGVPALAGLPWQQQRQIIRALVHAVWLRKSPVLGEGARRHVPARLWLVWLDDPVRPVLPSAIEGDEGSVTW